MHPLWYLGIGFVVLQILHIFWARAEQRYADEERRERFLHGEVV